MTTFLSIQAQDFIEDNDAQIYISAKGAYS